MPGNGIQPGSEVGSGACCEGPCGEEEEEEGGDVTSVKGGSEGQGVYASDGAAAAVATAAAQAAEAEEAAEAAATTEGKRDGKPVAGVAAAAGRPGGGGGGRGAGEGRKSGFRAPLGFCGGAPVEILPPDLAELALAPAAEGKKAEKGEGGEGEDEQGALKGEHKAEVELASDGDEEAAAASEAAADEGEGEGEGEGDETESVEAAGTSRRLSFLRRSTSRRSLLMTRAHVFGNRFSVAGGLLRTSA